MKQFGASSTRGIAIIDAKTSVAALDDLIRAGIRGIRVDMRGDVTVARQRFKEATNWVAGRNLHLQLQAQLPMIEAMKDDIGSSRVAVSIDHIGNPRAELGLEQPGFQTLLALVKNGTYVKLTRINNISKRPPDYKDALPFVQAVIAANAQRVVWGTDWPHLGVDGFDDGLVLNQLALWAPDATTRKAILVDNPARLYGF